VENAIIINMSTVRTVAKHTSIQVVGKILGLTLSIVVIGLLTRYLQAEGYGNYTTVLAYLFFFTGFADLGLYVFTINELVKAPDKSKLLSNIYGLRSTTGLFFLMLAVILVWFFPYPQLVKLGVVIAALSIYFALLDQISVAFYQTEMSMHRAAMAEVIGKALILTGTAVAVILQLDLLAILIAMLAGMFFHFLINYLGVKRKIQVKFEYDLMTWRKIIAKTWPIAVYTIFVLIYFKSDTVLLSILRPIEVAQTEVGIYGAPYKILEVLIGFPPLLLGLVSPILAQAWVKGSKEKFQRVYQKTFDALSVVTWPMVMGGVILATPILNLLAPGFPDSDKILQILILATGLIFWAHLPTFALVALDKQRQMMKFYLIAVVLALTGYIGLIPRFGYWAAAWVTVGVELFILLTASYMVFKTTRLEFSYTVFTKSLLAALVMGSVLYYTAQLNIFLSIALGIIVYGVLSLLFKSIDKNSINSLIKREL
jgi:O-antigen/teichoic acid export membrane protein